MTNIFKKLAFGMLFLFCLHASAQQSSKPNIIFIMVDDLGSAELGSYGNTFNETPNLDKLASNGAKFTLGYTAAAICSPSRAAIVTGQYPARIGITDFLDDNADRYLDPNKYVTINRALDKVGYHTGIIGKWHLDTKFDNPKGNAAQHGFHEVIGTETKYIGDGDYFYPYVMNENLNADGYDGEYLTDRQCKEAVSFIDRNQKSPFFLYLTFYSVHTRLDAPKHLVDKYKQKFDKKYGTGKADELFEKDDRHEGRHLDNPYLAAMIETIDTGVGSIMNKLQELGIANNTMIVFFSDNGGVWHLGNNGILRAGKSWLYEGGIRESLIVNWPAKIKPHTVIHTPVYGTDFYPTFLEMANATQYGGDIVDGVSFLPTLLGKNQPKRDAFYWHYPSETGKWVNRMCSAIRFEDYKLLYFYKAKRIELYDLKNDPSEKNDLANIDKERASKMKTMLDKWLIDVNAETPNVNPIKNKN